MLFQGKGVIPGSFVFDADFQIFPSVIGSGKEEVVIQSGIVVIGNLIFSCVVHGCLCVNGGIGVNVICNARLGVKVIVILLSCCNHRPGNRNRFF